MVKENSTVLDKAKEQIQNGLDVLIKAFRPRQNDKEVPDGRYWYLQLHRLIACSARNVQDEEVLRGADAVLLRNLLRAGGVVAATARLLCHFDCPSRRDCLQRGDARRGDRRRLYGGAEQGRPSEIHRLARRVL